MAYRYYKKPFTRTVNKDDKIEKAMDRKDKSIREFTDNKTISIAISSAFNGAKDIAVAFINAHINDIDEKRFWELHKEIYLVYLQRFIQAQVDGIELYSSIKGRYESIKDKEISSREIEINADIIQDDKSQSATDNRI